MHVLQCRVFVLKLNLNVLIEVGCQCLVLLAHWLSRLAMICVARPFGCQWLELLAHLVANCWCCRPFGGCVAPFGRQWPRNPGYDCLLSPIWLSMVGAVVLLMVVLHHLVGNECGLDLKGGRRLVHRRLVQIGYRL